MINDKVAINEMTNYVTVHIEKRKICIDLPVSHIVGCVFFYSSDLYWVTRMPVAVMLKRIIMVCFLPAEVGVGVGVGVTVDEGTKGENAIVSSQPNAF